MTKYLKLRSNNIIVKCILGIIILSIILSTISIYKNQESDEYIVIVNGEKISLKLFQNMYFIEREKQKKIFDKNFIKFNQDENFVKRTYNYVLNQLIDNVLLEQYAKKIQLQVTDYKIKEMILNSPMFQENKQFSKKKYFNYLNSIHLTNHEYINTIKTKINTEYLIHTIANTNFILKNERNEIVKLLSQKRIIQTSLFNTHSLVNKQKVTDIEAQKYFYKHKNHFYTPEKFKIRFVKFQANDFKIKCNNIEIKNWYLKNIHKYFTKEKRRYSIIQIKNKNEALSILSILHNKPQEFSKLAKEKSEDPISSKQGGNIGWISIDSMPNIIRYTNLTQENQISNIIPFKNQFIIIKLDKIIHRKQKKINEVYNTIKKEIKKTKSLRLYHDLQNKISNFITIHPNQFELVLKENNMHAQETNWFDKYSIPKELNIPILKKHIFNKKSFYKNNKFTHKLDLIKLKNNQSFLINIINFQNKKVEIFKNVKQKVIDQIKFLKAKKEAKKQLELIIHELKQDNTTLFKKLHLTFSHPKIISRYDQNPITSIVFALPYPKNGKKIYTLYQDQNNNFAIILLKKIYKTSFSQKEKNIIFEYLERNNTEIIFNAILKNLRQKSTIIYKNIKNI